MTTDIVTPEEIGQFLKDRDINQADLARMAGINRGQISRYVSGQSNCKGRSARKIRQAMGGDIRPPAGAADTPAATKPRPAPKPRRRQRQAEGRKVNFMVYIPAELKDQMDAAVYLSRKSASKWIVEAISEKLERLPAEDRNYVADSARRRR